MWKLYIDTEIGLMKARTINVETSVEFAVDNAIERSLVLEGKDRNAILGEYKEWFSSSKTDIEILVINYGGMKKFV